jgi:periplasmic protein TonB
MHFFFLLVLGVFITAQTYPLPKFRIAYQADHRPMPQPINCYLTDSMPNGYRKSDDKTVMPNGYRKSDDKTVMPNGYRKPEELDRDMIFTSVEQPPTFPGGIKALKAFIKANVRLPDQARKAEVKDRVFASFVVEKDGTISSLTILKGLGFGCDEEALRVLALMPRWEPGKQSGATIRVKYTLPIAFGLD